MNIFKLCTGASLSDEEASKLKFSSCKSEFRSVEYQTILVAMGENAANPVEGPLDGLRPCDHIINYLLEVFLSGGGGAVLQDFIGVLAVTIP